MVSARFCQIYFILQVLLYTFKQTREQEISTYKMEYMYILNTKKTGGGGGGGMMAPPQHFARLLSNAQSSRRDTLTIFFLSFLANFDTKFVTPRGYGSEVT